MELFPPRKHFETIRCHGNSIHTLTTRCLLLFISKKGQEPPEEDPLWGTVRHQWTTYELTKMYQRREMRHVTSWMYIWVGPFNWGSTPWRAINRHFSPSSITKGFTKYGHRATRINDQPLEGIDHKNTNWLQSRVSEHFSLWPLEMNQAIQNLA